MTIKHRIGVILALAALVGAASAVSAEVIVNPDGTGFVGKGDVQLVYGWNNQQLQSNAGAVQFQSTLVSERAWECTNSFNQKVQERERTTTSTQLVVKVDRVRNQITGFILSGYTGSPSTTTGGPPLNSCPAPVSNWTLTSPAGDPVVVSAGLQVSIDGSNWSNL